MFLYDLHDIIVSFIDNFTDLMSWRHTCSLTFHDYTANFYCSKMYPFINTPKVYVNDTTNIHILSRRKYITSLIIGNYKIRDEHIFNLRNLENLQILNNVFYLRLTEDSFGNFENLKTLIWKHSANLNDNILLKLKSLVRLNCHGCYNITSNSLSKLTNLTDLICTNIPDLDMSFLTNLHKLEYLHIDNYDGIQTSYILNLTQLKRLTLSEGGISPSIVKTLPRLEQVYCSNHEFTDDHIMHLTNLKILICGINCFFTELSFNIMASLEKLHLNNCSLLLTPVLFNNLVNLQELQLGSIQITDNMMTKLYNLKTLICENNTTLTDISLTYIPNITYLSCGRNTNFTDEGLAKLSKLKILHCGDNTNFGEYLISISHQLKSIEFSNFIANNNFINMINLIRGNILKNK